MRLQSKRLVNGMSPMCTKSVRWSHADPDRKALTSLPDLACMTIDIKDALAETLAEALGHLVRVPEFEGVIDISGGRPSYTIADIKVLAKPPSPAYANEVCAEVGNETILQTLHDVAHASAVVLEISGPRVVGVNDRFGEDDPGDDAEEDQDAADPDFIELTLAGVPGCIRSGTVTWEADGGVRLVSPDAAQVGATVTHVFADGPSADQLHVYVEGIRASEATDDVEITCEIVIDGSEDNPVAFRGETLEATFRLSVTDLRWTGWKEDNVGGKSGERTELLVCDLDLRPAVKITKPEINGEFLVGRTTHSGDKLGDGGDKLVVEGEVRSMIDIVTDIRVNGEPVPRSQIFFLGHTVEGMTAGAAKELTDRPPPYDVTFEYELSPTSEGYLQLTKSRLLVVAAVNGSCPYPGKATISLDLTTCEKSEFSQNNYNVWTEVYATFADPWPSDPAYMTGTMVDFYDGTDQKFLYKTEVDHCGRGNGIVACYDTSGAQPGCGLYRLARPVLFLDSYGEHPSNTAIPPPGLHLCNVQEAVTVEYNNGETLGVRKLFPVDLQIEDGRDEGGLVPDAEEWTQGALLLAGGSNWLLRVLSPEHEELPDDAVLTLSVKNYGVQPNPFADFETRTWSRAEGEFSQLPAEFSLGSTNTGVAAFELEMTSEKYGLLARDRVKVVMLPPCGLHPDRNRDRLIKGL